MPDLSKRIFWVPLLVLLLAVLGGYVYCYLPYDRQAREEQVDIPQGERLKGIATALAEKRLIRFPRLFVWLARLSKLDRGIRAGGFRLHSSMSPREILDNLNSDRVFLHRITIPEGLTLWQIAKLLEAEGVASSHEVLQAALDPRFVRELGVDGDTLEGYLYPDTYALTPGQSPREIMTLMVRRFWRAYGPPARRQQIALGWKTHAVVTLASIIEKETARQEEKPLVSSTLHNRLQQDMPLQCDPTVIYGLGRFDGNLRREHLLQPNPYNTYLNRGLPPGPICSPGMDSLLAAVNPARTTYLYFVSRNDGTHQFSSTIGEHNLAVRKFQVDPGQTPTVGQEGQGGDGKGGKRRGGVRRSRGR